MAKVHKAHKSTKKYGFQKKHISVKTLLIILAVIVVAGICLKVAYDNYKYGEFEVAAPSNEQLNNIADNWAILDSHTDKFMNYYTMLGMSADGTDGSGNAVLLYIGNENLEEVSIQVIDVNNNDTATEATASGAYARTTLTDFINGAAPWGMATKQVIAGNGNVIISVLDQDTDALDGAVLADVIAEIEAIIAEGPVVVEEAPVEEAAETTEEVPAE